MAEFETVDYSKLDPLNLALTNFFAHSLPNGRLYRNTISELATFLAPYVSTVGSSGYIEVNSNTLPNPLIPLGFSIIGKGVYTQTGEGDLTANGDLNIISWNSSTWILLKEINIGLSDYAKKTDIINKVDEQIIFQFGKNLFDKSKYDSSKIIEGPSATDPGKEIDSPSPDLGLFRFVNVLPSTQYTISNQSRSDSIRIAYYNSSNNVIGSVIDGISMPYTFTTPSNTFIVKIVTTHALQVSGDELQIELGPSVTDYEDFVVQIKSDLLDSYKISEKISYSDIIEQKKNIFNKSLCDFTKIIDGTGSGNPGAEIPAPTPEWMLFRTPISELESYVFSDKDRTLAARYAFYDVNDDVIGGIVEPTTPFVLSSPLNAVTLKIALLGLSGTMATTYINDRIQLEKGTNETAYESDYIEIYTPEFSIPIKKTFSKSLRTVLEIKKDFQGVTPAGLINTFSTFNQSVSGLTLNGAANQNLLINKYTNCREQYQEAIFQINTIGTIYLGTKSDGVYSYDGVYSPNLGSLKINFNFNDLLATSTGSLVLGVNDLVKMTFRHFYDTWICTVEKLGEPSTRIFVQYTLPMDGTSTNLQSINAKPRFTCSSGQISIRQWNLTLGHESTKNVFFGNSIVTGFYAGSRNNNFQFKAFDGDYSKFTTVSGPGYTIRQLISYADEVIELNPVNVVLEIGTNDILQGRTTDQFYTDYEELVFKLISAGINVIPCTTALINGSVRIPYNDKIDLIATKYKLKVARFDQAINSSGMFSDGVHWNSVGMQQAADKLKTDIKELFN